MADSLLFTLGDVVIHRGMADYPGKVIATEESTTRSGLRQVVTVRHLDGKDLKYDHGVLERMSDHIQHQEECLNQLRYLEEQAEKI